MASLSDAGVQRVFASAVADLHRSWPRLTARERRGHLQAAVDAAASAARKPGWEVRSRALAAGLDGQLKCDGNTWCLEVTEAFVEGPNDDGEAWLGSVSALYHEMRHGEQWYVCAQGILANRFPLPGGARPADPAAGIGERDLRGALGLPGAVARHVLQRSRQLPHDLPAATRVWYDSLFGAGRRPRGRVLETIQHAGKVADHLHLPEERDAWDLQQSVREKIGALIGPTLDRRAYAALRSLFGE